MVARLALADARNASAHEPFSFGKHAASTLAIAASVAASDAGRGAAATSADKDEDAAPASASSRHRSGAVDM